MNNTKSETRTAPSPRRIGISPELNARVARVHLKGLSLQINRDPVSAAKAAQDAGQPLSKYILAQAAWRGIDPAPYLKQIDIDTIGTEPIACKTHPSPSSKPLVHLELTDCTDVAPVVPGTALAWDLATKEGAA